MAPSSDQPPPFSRWACRTNIYPHSPEWSTGRAASGGQYVLLLRKVTNQSGNTARPAERLVGKVLPNGWTVLRRLDRPAGATGGAFSTSYVVRSANGEEAFLKAMDYTRSFRAEDPARALEVQTAAFNFERDLLERCRTRRLHRIVGILDSGILRPDDGNDSETVQYLIFEKARGDIRALVDAQTSLDASWTLEMMHQVAAAVRQLHSIQVAHQDIKPSNVLVFTRNQSKLGDLGRASDRANSSPHDDLPFAGDGSYAPPELLYRHVDPDWNIRRFGTDLYLLGSLFVFFCAGVSMTHILTSRLAPEHRYYNWKGTYPEVLPYIDHTFGEIVEELRSTLADKYSDQVANFIVQLCHPDPHRRGHPRAKERGGSVFGLDRYVTTFDRLSRVATWSDNRKSAVDRVVSGGRI